MRAIVLAGGRGQRLQPYTAVFPKPLMPLGDRPILEIVVGQLRQAGFTQLTFAVGHLAGLIEAYFGDGRRFGVDIDYSIESTPLGTAGPLGLIDNLEDDFLLMNGDILTDLDFGALLAEHRRSNAMATVAVYRKSVDITLGVLQLDDDNNVVSYDEKPSMHFLASTGIYCFRPDVRRHLEIGAHCDLPDLVRRLVAAGEPVRGHRFEGYWLDIGRHEDYEVAIAAVAEGRLGSAIPAVPDSRR